MENATTRTGDSSVITLKIPPRNIKRLDDPFSAKRYCYEAQVPVTEAEKLIIGNANPRNQNLKSRISGEIRDSLSTTPELFHLKNRGIWIAARVAEYDNQSSLLTLQCPQNADDPYGAIDGGHTLANIQQFLSAPSQEDGAKRKTPYVKLHINVGVEDELPELVETLNRSAQLKEYTIVNCQGEFDELEALFKKTPFAKEVDYKENGLGEWDVVEVLQRISLFSQGLFPGKYGKHPVETYRSKARCLDYYLKNKKEFLALEPILVDCFRMIDIVERILPTIASSGRFGGYQFATTLKKPETRPSLVSAEARDGVKSWARTHNVSAGVTFPLAASLRVLVRIQKDGKVIGWRHDPVQFFKENGGELFKVMLQENETNPTILGKDPDVWKRLYHAAYECLYPGD